MKITVNTQETIARLKGNREKHIEEHKMQIEGWKKAMSEFTKLLGTWSKDSGRWQDRPKEPQRPESYVNSYDQYIEKLTFHLGETVELMIAEFNEIIKDDFGWKGSFLASSNTYNVHH